MRDYEIRILSSGHPIAIIEAMHLSDHAAVKSARDLAGEKSFEVWRGNDCIYAPPRPHPAPPTGSVLTSAGAWMKRVLHVNN